MTDTGRALRALYQPQGGVGAIFDDKVRDYIAARPDYPRALIDALADGLARPAAEATVADLGAGSGLLTRALLSRFGTVWAVEPGAPMRAACDAMLGGSPGYRSAAGAAEAIPLPAGSVDLITAAQAFHWFDVPRARAEARRVLAPGGQVALVWNDRVGGDPLHQALDALFAEFGGAKRSALVAHEERRGVDDFFGAAGFETRQWPHAHALDRDGLLALAFSRSYMPARDTPAGRAATARLDEVFARHAEGGQVQVRYTTVLMRGAPG